jgi:hypothetical protein
MWREQKKNKSQKQTLKRGFPREKNRRLQDVHIDCGETCLSSSEKPNLASINREFLEAIYYVATTRLADPTCPVDTRKFGFSEDERQVSAQSI